MKSEISVCGIVQSMKFFEIRNIIMVANKKLDKTSSGAMVPLSPEQSILSFNINYKIRSI